MVLDYRGREPWVYVGAHRDRYPRRVVVVQPRPIIVRQRGLPPGQAKKMAKKGYVVVPANGAYYPEEHYGKHEGKHEGKEKGHGKGKH